MQVQWYPGHMTKAKRAMQEDIKLVDLVIELVDARSPLSSRNPDIDTLGKNKARLILLNKADLADPAANQAWTGYFEKKGYTVVRIDARRKADLKPIQAAVMTACKEKIERDRRRGIKNRSGPWWWGSPMWESPRLSIPMQAGHVQRPEINQV